MKRFAASKAGIAFVGQSGGLLGHFQRAADGRDMPLSYVISTGNEAGLEITDFLEFLADDPATRVIALYCRADPAAAGISRRHPALPRRRQAGRADAGRAAAPSRASRRSRTPAR